MSFAIDGQKLTGRVRRGGGGGGWAPEEVGVSARQGCIIIIMDHEK